MRSPLCSVAALAPPVISTRRTVSTLSPQVNNETIQQIHGRDGPGAPARPSVFLFRYFWNPWLLMDGFPRWLRWSTKGLAFPLFIFLCEISGLTSVYRLHYSLSTVDRLD